MIWQDINKESKKLIDKLKLLSFKISAAESCTGGLLSLFISFQTIKILNIL